MAQLNRMKKKRLHKMIRRIQFMCIGLSVRGVKSTNSIYYSFQHRTNLIYHFQTRGANKYTWLYRLRHMRRTFDSYSLAQTHTHADTHTHTHAHTGVKEKNSLTHCI